MTKKSQKNRHPLINSALQKIQKMKKPSSTHHRNSKKMTKNGDFGAPKTGFWTIFGDFFTIFLTIFWG